MSFINNMRAGPVSAARNPADEHWWSKIGAQSVAGVNVTHAKVLGLPVVSAALSVLSDPLATLPIIFYRRQVDGSKQRIDNHPLSAVFRTDANEAMGYTAHTMRGTLQWNLALTRNAVAIIHRSQRGIVGDLEPVHYDSLTIKKTPSGPVYEVHTGATTDRYTADQVWHLRSYPLSADGITGESMVMRNYQTFGGALALQEYANRFFANDATPPGYLEHPGNFADKTQRADFSQAWRSQTSGKNQHKTPVLEYGMKYNRVGVTNDEAQFLETSKETDLRCLRVLNVQPHKVGILDNATFTNIEHQSLEFVTETLVTWLTLWEQSIKQSFILEPDVYAEFNVAGLLRGDLKARYEAYAIGRNWGWLSVNEIRKLESMNGIETGNEYLTPLNMTGTGNPAPKPGNSETPNNQRRRATDQTSSIRSIR